MLTQSQIRSYWAPRCTGPFATVSLYGNGKVTVDAAIVSAVKSLNTVLAAYRYSTRAADTGAYNCRLNTSGTGYSMHAYGIAIDINWLSNPYSRYLKTDMFKYGDGRMPHRICAIRTNNGKQVWNWGGFWSGNKDTMHYEVVCTPADLRTGINPSTIYGGAHAPAAPAPAPAPKPAPTPEDEDVRLIVKGKDKPQWYITDGIVKEYIESSQIANELAFLGLAKLNNGQPYVLRQGLVDSIPTIDQMVERTLNKGTGTGQANWATTNKSILSTVQGILNKVNT